MAEITILSDRKEKEEENKNINAQIKEEKQ